jgi:hypothetical protein
VICQENNTFHDIIENSEKINMIIMPLLSAVFLLLNHEKSEPSGKLTARIYEKGCKLGKILHNPGEGMLCARIKWRQGA